jgi:uncharacterized membrane protein YdjX (TVP38/TMEM64 family)
MPSQFNATNHQTRVARIKWVVFIVVVLIVALACWQLSPHLTLAELARRESLIREFHQQHPALIYGLAFLVYVTVTGLSIPGAAVLSLAYGWYFGFIRALILVSFSSTAGATLAFLLCRFLFRDTVQRRFRDRLQSFNRAFEREGPYFLFGLRLIPAVPFFVINAVMGLTPIRVRTFWWVSQLGMLPATIVFVYAGSSVPRLQTLAEQGVAAVFSPSQLTQIIVAFMLLGIFPLAIRGILNLTARRRIEFRDDSSEFDANRDRDDKKSLR